MSINGVPKGMSLSEVMMVMIDVLRPLCAQGRLNGPSDLQRQ